jgi:CheY-like chemotaxis protein/MinD-like ATPase involved in chromosome partitioning or flagellar assembly
MSKILVVDDDPGVLRLLEYVLSHQGYQVLTAANGIEGLRIAQQEGPELVVLDVMLPGMDGFEVCHRLRSNSGTAGTPVLMLSAKGQESDKSAGVKVGANEYLVKPIDRVELLKTVETLLATGEQAMQMQAKVIGFIGSRGGVGTSTVVASVAIVLAQSGLRTVVVDLCPSFGALPALMGLKPQLTIAELFRARTGGMRREELDAALAQHHTGVRLLSGDQGAEGYVKVTPESIDALLQELRTLADYILIDMPASPSELVGAALRRCDSVDLIACPGHESMARADSAAALLSRLGVDQKRIGLVIVDRAGADAGAETSNPAVVGGYPVMGIVPFDAEECADAEQRGVPVVLSAPLSPVAVAMCQLTENLLRREQLTPSAR